MFIFSKKSKGFFIQIGILFLLLLLFLFSLLGSQSVLNLFGLSKVNTTIFFISRLLYWLVLLLVWFYSIKVEKQPLLIWEERKYKLSTYIAAIIVIILILFICLIFLVILFYFIVGKTPTTSTKLLGMVNIFRENKLLVLFTVLTAGIVEELIFRGYLQPRLEIIFKNPYLAIIISSILFALLHYGYGTVINVIGPFIIGLVFSYYYWKYRNIKVLIICHFLWDLFSTFLLLKRGH